MASILATLYLILVLFEHNRMHATFIISSSAQNPIRHEKEEALFISKSMKRFEPKYIDEYNHILYVYVYVYVHFKKYINKIPPIFSSALVMNKIEPTSAHQ